MHLRVQHEKQIAASLSLSNTHIETMIISIIEHSRVWMS